MKEIIDRLSTWYKNNKRTLPWRQTSDPYLIWLSEVILQQTRIQQGMSYYLRFAEKYPTVYMLAKADIDEVLKLWQGLGYYTRARNLHTTAKTIVEKYNGIFPNKYLELLKLKGVGEYTAAAIASIAFGEAVPVIDGNVARVVARLFMIEEPINSNNGKNALKKFTDDLIDKKNPGNFNQAIMEFGSLQCTPLKPNCKNCTLNKYCLAYKNSKVDVLPYKLKSNPQKIRYFYYLVIINNNNIIIKKREGKDIWQGLYEFPMAETDKKLSKAEIVHQKFWGEFSKDKKIIIKTITKEYKHILSHRIIKARFIFAETTSGLVNKNNSCIITPNKNLRDYAVPRLIERFLEDYNMLSNS